METLVPTLTQTLGKKSKVKPSRVSANRVCLLDSQGLHWFDAGGAARWDESREGGAD